MHTNLWPRIVAALIVVVMAGGAIWYTARDEPVRARPLVYVALGASDAVGIGARVPYEQGWVPRVYAGLPRGARLVNLGISGATTADVAALELPVASDAAPALVTIWPGINDLRAGTTIDTFSEQLERVLAGLSDSTLVVVLNIPDLRAIPVFATSSPDRLDARVQEWNSVIDTIARRHAAIVVDLYGSAFELANHPEYVGADGFHPSSAGHQRIADLVLEALAAVDPDAFSS